MNGPAAAGVGGGGGGGGGGGPNQQVTSIKDLKPGMNSLNLSFIVIDIGRAITTKENQEVRTVKVADRTGMVNLSLWNEPGKVGNIVFIINKGASPDKDHINVFKTPE